MHRLVVVALAVCVAACGGGSEPPPPAPTSTAVPELARAPKADGEILVTGEGSPSSHGPFEFSGEYTVRFQQHAPEDPAFDFGGATSFVAALDREAEITGGDSIELFEAARTRQSRTLEIEGRYFVDVSFGDFPYVIRFTPVDG